MSAAVVALNFVLMPQIRIPPTGQYLRFQCGGRELQIGRKQQVEFAQSSLLHPSGSSYDSG